MKNIKRILLPVFLFIFVCTKIIWAGPPFDTDDPQPVDFMHWEFYVSSAMEFAHHNESLTLPHFEINYGAIPNLQIHLLAPLGYVKAGSQSNYGYMDTEVGVKYMFFNSSDGFMAGVFPLIEIPTGNANKQLGNGKTQVFIPLWLQKSWGKFTSYGGGGYWINPGTGNKNWTFIGWEGQYDFSSVVTLGGEIYYQTADTQDGTSLTGFHLGGIINIDDHNHILFSFGRNFNSSEISSGYLGYQVTI